MPFWEILISDGAEMGITIHASGKIDSI